MGHLLPVPVRVLAAVLLWTSSAAAQQPSQPSELYHVHVVKAAAGKLPQLIEEYKNLPPAGEGQPAAPPIILRHQQGGEWDLMVISARGRQATISAGPPAEAVQAGNERRAPLADWHGDTFVVGPSWEAVQKALLPAGGTGQSVYVVSDYRAIPGHRAQLQKVLESNAQETPGRAVRFSHVEGAPWNFLVVTRYDSWAEVGAPPPRSAGQDPGLPIREHLAVHHDTIAIHVPAGTR